MTDTLLRRRTSFTGIVPTVSPVLDTAAVCETGSSAIVDDRGQHPDAGTLSALYAHPTGRRGLLSRRRRDGLTELMLDRDDLSRELETDLRNGGVYAVFQPLIEIATGDLVGVEGLCRWSRSRGPAIQPEVFIPVAEATGLIHELGRFMLDECLAAADQWRSHRT